MLRAVLFDLDGTLLDTIPDIAGGLNSALTASGLPTHPVRAYEAFVGGGIRAAVVNAAPAGTEEPLIDTILTHYHDVYLEHCTDETVEYPGTTAMLTALADRGVALGVLSNKTEATAQRIIRHFFPTVPFRCVFGRTPDRPLKPDAKAAEPALHELGLQPGEIAYVGDSGTDMTFARAVGMLPVGTPWGYRSREDLLSCGAQLLADTPEDLLRQLLERI